MNSTQMLNKITEDLKNDYQIIKLDYDDDLYFVMPNGVVFEVIYLPPFDCFTISYADCIEKANNGLFEEGEQFDAKQDYAQLLGEIKDELAVEAA